VSALEARGVGFRSLTEAMDTTRSGGRLIFHVFGALAEFVVRWTRLRGAREDRRPEGAVRVT
jgi:DNA invertase Pin-like site-specific DNA recombinase